jgi:hypothetical protein
MTSATPRDQARALAARVHAVELSRFEQIQLTAATGAKGAHPQHIADLANALLTTAVETWG